MLLKYVEQTRQPVRMLFGVISFHYKLAVVELQRLTCPSATLAPPLSLQKPWKQKPSLKREAMELTYPQVQHRKLSLAMPQILEHSGHTHSRQSWNTFIG